MFEINSTISIEMKTVRAVDVVLGEAYKAVLCLVYVRVAGLIGGRVLYGHWRCVTEQLVNLCRGYVSGSGFMLQAW